MTEILSIPGSITRVGAILPANLTYEDWEALGVRVRGFQHRRGGIVARMEEKIVPVPETGCWLWFGCVNSSGYGSLGIGKKVYEAHRLSWMIHYGQIPDGMCVCHKCDIPSCVNPDHLFIATQHDNIKDMDNKGRRHSKLTDRDAQNIRILLRAGIQGKLIAEIYGVSKSAITLIKKGAIWREN